MDDFETLRAWINENQRGMVELETLLTSIPAIAPESGGEGESKKCAALKDWLLKAGFAESQFTEYDAPDSRVPSGVRPNLVLTIPGKSDDFAIWVMAHMDVVPTGELSLWESDPWTVIEKDGKLFGRGVEDNQQGLVSGVYAALACLKNGIVPEHTVKLLFMADEEFGSAYGMHYLLKEHKELFRQQDLFLIPDGGDPKGETIEIAEKNILWLKLHTIGKQSHGSMPDSGNNACLAACDLSLRLNALESCFSERDPLFTPDRSTFQPTKREANVQTVNIIPGDDVFYMDCRILPQYTLDQVRAEVKKRVQEVEAKYGVTIEVSELQAEQSPATSADAPVVTRLAAAIKEAHGITAHTVGIGGGTVGAALRNLGYSCAIWSTLDEVCHQPNEYCWIKNIASDAETLAALFIQK
ncbi:MAG: M20 family metallo-hydrolase [Treponema sp.]|nr:M20 family metallo-hydrolase [Treponema sp.]